VGGRAAGVAPAQAAPPERPACPPGWWLGNSGNRLATSWVGYQGGAAGGWAIPRIAEPLAGQAGGQPRRHQPCDDL